MSMTIIEILCRRDGISVIEATRRVNEAREMLNNTNWGWDEAEEIMSSELGLEIDYIDELF